MPGLSIVDRILSYFLHLLCRVDRRLFPGWVIDRCLHLFFRERALQDAEWPVGLNVRESREKGSLCLWGVKRKRIYYIGENKFVKHIFRFQYSDVQWCYRYIFAKLLIMHVIGIYLCRHPCTTSHSIYYYL